MTLASWLMAAVLGVLVGGQLALLREVRGLKEQVTGAKEQKKLYPPERSPELCLFEQLVTSYEPTGGTYRGYEIEVPVPKDKRRFNGQTNKVSMDLDSDDKVRVSFDGNKFTFPDGEQREARRIYDLAAAKSRAGAMVVIAEGAD